MNRRIQTKCARIGDAPDTAGRAATAASRQSSIRALAGRLSVLEPEAVPTPAPTSVRAETETLPLCATDLAAAIELTGDGLAAFDAAGRYTYVNPVAERILGRSAGDLLGRSMTEVFPEFTADPAYPHYIQTKEERTKSSCEAYSALFRCWLEVRCVPAEDGGVLLLFRDVTLRRLQQKSLRDTLETQNRRHAALALKQSAVRTQASDARFQALVAASALVVWTADAAGNAIMAEGDAQTWCAYTGQEPEEARGLGWLDAVHVRDRADVLALWKECVGNGEPFEVLMRVRRTDGRWRRLLSRSVSVRDADGAVREWIGTCTDIE